MCCSILTWIQQNTVPVHCFGIHWRSWIAISSRCFLYLCRFKLIKWWIQSFLVGIPEIISGYRDDNGIVHRLESLQTMKIPDMIKVSQTINDNKEKQVAQRATIAHLSPMCQGQMSWFSNLFETDETKRPWWIMCSYIRLGLSNRYWKNRSFDHP